MNHTNTTERDPREIESEIAHTRAEMDGTLTALERKLSPGQLLDEALGAARDGLERAVRATRDAATRDPVIAVLGTAAVAVAATYLATHRRSRQRRLLDQLLDDDTLARWTDLAADAVGRARTIARVGSGQAGAMARDTGREARRLADRTWHDAEVATATLVDRAAAGTQALREAARTRPFTAMAASLAAGALGSRLIR